MMARSLQKHVVIVGAVNAGKSTLFNSIMGSKAAIVSEVKGTTTDAVRKSIEVPGLGPVVFIDTAGFGDETALSDERLKKTRAEFDKADAFIYILNGDDESVLKELQKHKKPIIKVIMAIDREPDARGDAIIYRDDSSREEIFLALKKVLDTKEESLLDGLVHKGATIIMVMPQDAAAPKGRLIKAQVEALREALDKGMTSIVAVSYTHLTLPTKLEWCRSRWSPYH